MINQKLRKLFLPGLLFLFHTSFVFSEENLFFLYPQKGNTDTKIFVGFRGGINFTQPIPLKRYSVVSVNSLDNTGIKHYKSFLSNVGYQYGFIMTYSLTNNFAISFQPGFSQYTYNYSNSYSWTDNTNTSNQIDLTYESRHVLHYFELPLLIQYSYGSGTLKPYLQAGFQYGILQNAAARVTTNLTQRSITGDVPLNMDDNTGDVSAWYIRSRFTLLAGAGVRYDLNIFSLALDVSYYFGINNVVNEKGRYSIQNFSGGTYDVPDDISIHNLVINASLLFPINQTLRRINDSCKNLLKGRK
jgi:hypothetical protein